MAAHAVPEYGLALHIGWKFLRDQSGQFFLDIAAHAEVLCPRLFGGIDIKTGALSHVIGFIIGNVFTAR